MWSRRKFIFSIVASYAIWANPENNDVWARTKKARGLTTQFKPRLLAREYWSPAITCNFIDVFGDNLCCLVDEFGRLATANILGSVSRAHVYPTLGETVNLGSRVLYLKVIQPQLAVAVVQKHVNDESHSSERNKTAKEKEAREEQFALALIDLSAPRAPQIVSNTLLPNYTQINNFTVGRVGNRAVICISGTDLSGENRISLYGLKKNKILQLLSSFTLINSIRSLSLGEKHLLALHAGSVNSVSIINLANIGNPQFMHTVELPGDIMEIVCHDNTFVWSSRGEFNGIAVGDLNKFPQTEKKISFDSMFSIESLALNDKFLFVIIKDEESSTAIPFAIGENFKLSRQNQVSLVTKGSTTSKITLGHDCAFVTSSWAGVDVLTLSNNGLWAATTCSSIQKLPVAGLATWSNYLLLAAADLQLYDLSQPKQPKLVSTMKLPAAIKTMVTAGSYVLYLDKSGVTLSKIENPKTILATLSVSAQHLSLDQKNHKAYLIQSADDASKKKNNDKQRKTKLIELIVYNNSVETAKTFSVMDDSYCSSADEGYVLVGNLDNLAIYKPDQADSELVCQREFKDLAWRQIILSKGNIFATAIDQNVNGYFITMSFDGQAINSMGSIKIPHDGTALTINGDLAFATGQNADGSSLLTAIDINNLAKPHIVSSKTVIDSASAITVDNNRAIVAGQGFEIYSL